MKPVNYVPTDSMLTFLHVTRKHIGQKFGGKVTKAKGLYKCECGKKVELSICDVKCGHTKSCGCIRKVGIVSHGLISHPLYSIWGGIIQRCYNINSPSYPNYGAIGVKVCDEWRNDFKSFHDWALKNGWKPGLEIDKDKKAKEFGVDAILYSPEMCSIITHKENSNIKRNSRYLEHRGVRKSVSQWAEDTGIKGSVLFARLNLGWDSDSVLCTPVGRISKQQKLAKQIINFFESKNGEVSVNELSIFLNRKLNK